MYDEIHFIHGRREEKINRQDRDNNNIFTDMQHLLLWPLVCSRTACSFEAFASTTFEISTAVRADASPLYFRRWYFDRFCCLPILYEMRNRKKRSCMTIDNRQSQDVSPKAENVSLSIKQARSVSSFGVIQHRVQHFLRRRGVAALTWGSSLPKRSMISGAKSERYVPLGTYTVYW